MTTITITNDNTNTRNGATTMNARTAKIATTLHDVCDAARHVVLNHTTHALIHCARYDLAVDSVNDLAEVYLLTITLRANLIITARDVMEVAEQLDTFCTFNQPPFVGPDGREYHVGDGDDSHAVRFQDGAFHIWVRHFKEHNKFRTEFPDYDPASMPAIPATWTDVSWHNDSCPSFDTGTGLMVYVDYADPEQREFDSPRFSVIRDRETNDGCEVVLATDDWQAVLAATGWFAATC